MATNARNMRKKQNQGFNGYMAEEEEKKKQKTLNNWDEKEKETEVKNGQNN